ncbi:putative SPARC-like isoform X1 [Sesbania bispinosa]|nr:putative SPARC-like isoform X1 [Sesbania bispinosa]
MKEQGPQKNKGKQLQNRKKPFYTPYGQPSSSSGSQRTQLAIRNFRRVDNNKDTLLEVQWTSLVPQLPEGVPNLLPVWETWPH